MKTPEHVCDLCIWICGLKHRHIQPHRSQPFLFFPSPPIPPISWYLISSKVAIRICPLLLRMGMNTHLLPSGFGPWEANLAALLGQDRWPPALHQLLHQNLSWWLIEEHPPPTSWAEESDLLDAKTGINGASIHDLYLWCSEATTMYQAFMSRRRFMEKCTEWEIHSEKASTTCALIACVGS